MEPETVLEVIEAGNRAARQFTDDVEWSAEDGSRTDPDFLCRCVKPPSARVRPPSTFQTPWAIPRPRTWPASLPTCAPVPGADGVIFSTHNHNDLGLGVANTVAALKAGARQVECTINGIGERAGNAALEEIIMVLRTRHDVLPFTTGIHTERLLRTRACWPPSPALTCSPTRPSWAATRLRMKAASIRMVS